MSSRAWRTSGLRLLLVGGLAALLAGVLLLSVGQRVHIVRSPTMAPGLLVGDVALGTPVGDPGTVRRGDVVWFTPPWPESQGFGELVFRAVGVGGDRLSCCEGTELVVNGVPSPEPYVQPRPDVPLLRFDATVPSGRVFLMGDSRSLADDSRLHLEADEGSVDAGAVTDRLVGVVWPLTHWGSPEDSRGLPVRFVLGSALVVVGLLVLLIAVAASLRRRSDRRAERSGSRW